MADDEIRLTWEDIVRTWRSFRRPSPEALVEQERLLKQYMQWEREHPEGLKRAFDNWLSPTLEKRFSG